MKTVCKSSDWLSAKVDDVLVMMSAVKGRYIGLNPVGARIWELIKAQQDVDELCDRLRGEYDVTIEQCRSEVENFLEELAKHGALTIDIVSPR